MTNEDYFSIWPLVPGMLIMLVFRALFGCFGFPNKNNHISIYFFMTASAILSFPLWLALTAVVTFLLER